MLEIINELLTVDNGISLLIGGVAGWGISSFIQNKKYYSRMKYLLKTIENREEWINFLEKKIPKKKFDKSIIKYSYSNSTLPTYSKNGLHNYKYENSIDLSSLTYGFSKMKDVVNS
jgi:hypothetical protein